MRDNLKYDPRRPETLITSWVASFLIIGYIVNLVFSSALPTACSSQQTCTVVIVESLKQPVILPTNAFLHRAVVVTLKAELKFMGRLLHKYIEL
jgi:hypothetical protein